VHLSGSIDEPRQDLSQRIIEPFKESPGAYFGLMFRQFSDWLKKTFGGAAKWRGELLRAFISRAQRSQSLQSNHASHANAEY
jgi:hypothetical protein